MYKFIFALFIAFLSLSSLPAMAKNCSGGSIVFDIAPSDRGYYMTRYTSGSPGSLFESLVTVQNNMTCDPDYQENGIWMSQIIMQLTGGTCKNATTITTSYPGIEWKLQGMRCDGSSIISDQIKSGTTSWDGKIIWSSGAWLGKAILTVNPEYWMQNTQTGVYNIGIIYPSFGNTLQNSPGIPVSSTLGWAIPFQFLDTATCAMSLSSENVDFGKLTSLNVNNDSLYKELSVYYSCKNKALINGLYVRFEPENVVDAANGMFSASDNNGRKLNFKITRLSENEQTIPLNANYQILQATNIDRDATETFRIRVMPSTPFPTGKVSTYLNVSLIYR
ncbi:fimbrial protein [Citrobacter amalonaticus]|uniref:fimbrial protein n=1 Tax=Citrobacter amalonaticus TaxID=35703 RepID=UPI000F67105C|nr:fimbrial protein [Citrobacter amalonaticus]RSC57666.1 fimbrial protein [Citrobacter amalonaticus]